MPNKVLSNQRVTVLAGLASAISNWANPTLAELTALTNVSGAVNWDGFDLNIQASEQSDDRTLTDGAGAQSRGYTNFGGGIQFVHPQPTDTSSIFRLAYNLFSTPRVELVVAVRYGKLNSTAPAAGDRFTIYRLIVDAPAIGQNDVSKFYNVTLVARDTILVQYIVPPASPATIVVTLLAATATVGKVILAKAVYQGWDVTHEVTWVVSDATKLEQVGPGLFLWKAAGTPTIGATYPGATAATPVATTLS